MLIDTHSHVNFDAYKNDWEQVIARSLANNIWMINVGTKCETSKKAIKIAEKYPKGVYVAVGLHPIYAKEKFCIADYKNFIKSEKVIAIGEIGLDYKPEYSAFKERQKEIFLEQLDLAKELNLPVIFHCRMAHQDLLEILNKQLTGNNEQIKGVVHCFTGTLEQAEEYLKMGFSLGFNGIIFRNIKDIDFREIIKKIPFEKILLETDCPYLTPLSVIASAKAGPLPLRNEPLCVKYIAQEIAKIKNISFEQVAEITSKNARNFFNI